MNRIKIAQIIQRVTVEFIETIEHFSDGSTEFAVYYRRDKLYPSFI